MLRHSERTTAEIQAEIDRIRASLERDVTALEQHVRDTLDWRRHVREQPLSCCGAALAVGLVLAIL